MPGVQEKRPQDIYAVFDCLRFPLVLMVIYIHNGTSSVALSNGSVDLSISGPSSFLVNMVSQGVARIAVPLFYFMAGYLFFHGAALTPSTYEAKMRSRVKTLLIPFLFWTVFWLVFKFVLQNISATAPYFNSAHKPIAQYGLIEVANAILGISEMPSAYQFWFIRDLIILVIASPVIYGLIRTSRGLIALPFLLAWFASLAFPFYFSIEAATYFLLGSCMATFKVAPVVTRSGAALLALSLVTLVSFALSATLFQADMMQNLADKIGIFVGSVAALSLAGRAAESPRCRQSLSALSKYSFFLFAVHEPVLTICRKLLVRFLPNLEPLNLAIYLLLPVVVSVFAVQAYRVLDAISPSALRLVTGGRGGAAR
jgi:surface polysaccharide O-acyltransferase-like enzyme